MFKNAVETFNYFAEQCKVFIPVKEEFVRLVEENKTQKELIGSLGKQLVAEKLTRAKNEESLNALGKELIEIKLKSLKGDK